MGRLGMDGSDNGHASGAGRVYFGAVVWIVLLLACWFVIGHLDTLPELMTSTMAALP
jgi:hypothetical protein